jgi:chlorite dismutase
MTATRTARPQIASAEIPAMPLTVEGYSVLHQMMRFRWTAWRQLRAGLRREIVDEAADLLSKMEQGSAGQSPAQMGPAEKSPDSPGAASSHSSSPGSNHTPGADASGGQSALFSLLGHKGDLMFVHFRSSFDELNRAEMQISQLRLNDYMEPVSSYLSMIELGLYESSVKTYRELAERGLEAHSDEWKLALGEVLARQKEAMRPRLFPEIPKAKYACFYPMDRRRGEDKNWYTLPIEERARQMHEHGLVGRRYAGEVRQIISGSIGFDDWEWGVDLFADDPLVFKKLIYEMRFDEVSAVYALFGTFYVGVRCSWCNLGKLLNGETAE